MLTCKLREKESSQDPDQFAC